MIMTNLKKFIQTIRHNNDFTILKVELNKDNVKVKFGGLTPKLYSKLHRLAKEQDINITAHSFYKEGINVIDVITLQ